MAATEWIEHDGKALPKIIGKERLELRLRDGRIGILSKTPLNINMRLGVIKFDCDVNGDVVRSTWTWPHGTTQDDVVAYRIVLDWRGEK